MIASSEALFRASIAASTFLSKYSRSSALVFRAVSSRSFPREVFPTFFESPPLRALTRRQKFVLRSFFPLSYLPSRFKWILFRERLSISHVRFRRQPPLLGRVVVKRA